MSEVTYSRLGRVLRSLGFSCRTVTLESPALVYRHEGTGAMLAFPVFQEDEKVLPHHLAAVQGTLDVFGIAAPPEFAAQLQKAS